jgi:hypothetical protein
MLDRVQRGPDGSVKPAKGDTVIVFDYSRKNKVSGLYENHEITI